MLVVARLSFDSLTRRGTLAFLVRLPVRRRGETMYLQAHANTSLSDTPLSRYESFEVVFNLRKLFHFLRLFLKPLR